MFEGIIGAFLGGFVVVLAQLASPKVTDVIGNVHRSRALSSAKAVIAAEEARLAALAAAKVTVAAAAVQLPTPPPNPLAGPSGATSATGATGA